MLKKVLKSRVWCFILGVLVHALLLQWLPKGFFKGMFKAAWENKWAVAIGIAIGIAFTIIIWAIRNGFSGIHFQSPIARTYDDNDEV